ncbi:MAG TPA: ATP-binding protein [Pyrinomonadaceae bacterium]|nr:ATP-binding protein [Pyrinomonadaceae bacterium]
MLRAANDTVERQNEYVRKLNEQGFDYGLVVGEAFVRGMRDIGYKHTGTALDEDIDNAIEAGAENVHVVFGYGKDNGSESKPQMIAVIDDGHGMSPGMMRAAVLWGGGHRTDGNRELFGRYGFGLPSSSVSQGRRFEVYSRLTGGDWHMVAIDLDDIKSGNFYKENGRLAAPPATPAKLPRWVEKEIEQHYGKAGLTHGTVVLLSKLDNLTWKTTKTLNRELSEHFGVTYRKWLRRVNIYVNGIKVEPVDPLFLDPTARFHEENDLRAVPLPDTDIEVKDKESGKALGLVKVRYSYLPPGFQNVDGRVGGSRNARFNVMKENNGLLILRAGRQIDVVSAKCPWVTFVNYDRNWKVEIDFDPNLDEEFSITTSKQQVVLSDRMWTLLEQAGVHRAIDNLRKRYTDELAVAKEKQEQPEENEPRTSEEVMADSEKYKTKKAEPSPEQKQDREKEFKRKVKERAEKTGKSEEEAERDVEAEVTSMPYKLSFENIPGGSFYRVEGIASQVHLIINQAHPFFTSLYAGPDSTPRSRAGLELLLFVLAECELDASLERQLFYESERREWSQRFNTVLKLLEKKDPTADEASARAERAEVEENAAAVA